MENYIVQLFVIRHQSSGIMSNQVPKRFISLKKTMDVDTNTLWELITRPGHLEDVHPYCSSNEAISWNSEGCQDVLIYSNGRTFIRNIEPWAFQEGYDLWIGPKNGLQSFVKWRIESIDDTSSLEITIYPSILNKWPLFITFIPFHFWIKPRLNAYLNAVLGGIYYFLDNDSPVPRDMPNPHPWFS